MKFYSTFIAFLVLSFTSAFDAYAQTANVIWIQANMLSYKTNETAIVTVSAVV